MGGRAVVGGARAIASFFLGLLLCSVTVTALLGEGLNGLKQKPLGSWISPMCVMVVSAFVGVVAGV